MNPLSSPLVATPLALALLFTAPLSRADDSRDDDKDAVTKWVAADSTKNPVLVEKLSNSQDQRAFSIPLLTYDQPTWTPICVTPCRVKLDLNLLYRVAPFNGASSSRPFALPPDVATLHVEPGSAAVDYLGRVLAVAGGFVLASGVVTTAAAEDRDTRRTGIVVGAAGLLGILIGLPMHLLSGTHVRFN